MDSEESFEYYKLDLEETNSDNKSASNKSYGESDKSRLQDTPINPNKKGSKISNKQKPESKLINNKKEDLINYTSDKKEATSGFILQKRKNRQIKKMMQILNKIEDKLNSLKNEPEKVVLYDKRFFCIGICTMFFTNAILFYPNPHAIKYQFTFVNVSLLILRWFEYQSKGEHYFFLDYCYIANTFTLIYLFFFPDNQLGFQLSFMFMGGPTLLSIPLFGLKLVLKDCDTWTSFAMHFYPFFIFLKQRHFQLEENSGFLTSNEIDEWVYSFGLGDVIYYYMVSIFCYQIWSLSYYFVVLVLLDEYLMKKKYTTLFTFLLGVDGMWNNISMVVPDKIPILFMLGHFTLAIVGFLQCLICLYSPIFMTIYLLAILLFSIYMGSIYYFNYSTKKLL